MRRLPGDGLLPRGSLDKSLICDLRAADYSGGPAWRNRAPGARPDAAVPCGVEFDSADTAFLFSGQGELIELPLATSLLPEATFAVWVKVVEPFPRGNLGWILAQAPDYTWSRALTLNDFRLGHASATTSRYWDSQLGRVAVGEWVHLVGVWRQEGSCTAFLDGVAGATCEAKNGRGCAPDERLVIGGRDHGDRCHNAAVAVADVRVYARALSDTEVVQLHRLGLNAGGVARTTPRLARSAAVGPRSPWWDEDTKLFWFPTGVDLHELPDGHVWQKEFQSAVQQCQATSAPGEVRQRALRRHQSDDQGPAPTGASKGRELARHPSDPEKLAGRAAHTAALRAMPHRAGAVVQVHNQEIALFRFGEKVHAVQAACPHQGASLADGEIGDMEDMVDGHRSYVACPVHKFQFDLSTGAVLHGRSCGTLPIFVARAVRRGGAGLEDEPRAVEVGFPSLGAGFFSPGCAEDF